MKPYARLALEEAEFELLRGTVTASRERCFKQWTAAHDAQKEQEKTFYAAQLERLDALLQRFHGILVADTSQDAAAEEDEDEEEAEDNR